MTLQPFAGQNTQQIFKNCGSGKTLIRLIQKREGVRVNYKKEHHYLEKRFRNVLLRALIFCCNVVLYKPKTHTRPDRQKDSKNVLDVHLQLF